MIEFAILDQPAMPIDRSRLGPREANRAGEKSGLLPRIKPAKMKQTQRRFDQQRRQTMDFHPAVIQGGKIVLNADLPLPNGQRVEVVVLPVPRDRVPGEGILRIAGALADDPDFDADMADVLKARRVPISGTSG